MGGQATSNALAALLVARVPAWETVDHVGHLTDPPITLADAVELLNGSPRTHVWHQTVFRQDRRTIWVYVKTVDTSATYTVSLAGVPFAFDAAAGNATSRSDILDGIHDTIVAAAPATFTSNKVVEGVDTVALRLETTPSGDSSAPSTIVVDDPTATLGGEIEVYAEVPDFNYQVWLTAVSGVSDNPPDSGQWFQALDTDSSIVPQMQILNTAGAERFAVVVNAFTPIATDGPLVQPAFYIFIGPSTDETVAQEA